MPTKLYFALYQISTFHYSHIGLVENGLSFYLKEFSFYVFTKTSVVAAAVVAQSVKRPHLRSLKSGATELM